PLPLRIQTFIIKNFIPLGLLIITIISLSYPSPGIYALSLQFASQSIISFINIFIVFLISGLILKTADLYNVLNTPLAIVYALLAINVFTSLPAFVFLRLPLETKEFGISLAVICVAPTTLGLGVALTQVCVCIDVYVDLCVNVC